MSLSVVVPAYNEEGNLEPLVRGLEEELPSLGVSYEIILVDDGSLDGTDDVADRLAREWSSVHVVHHARNRGYGAANRTGFALARHDWVMVIPSDQQFTAREIRLLWEAREGVDLVASYRRRRMDPWARSVGSFVFNTLMRLLYGIRVRDINWVKMWRRAALAEVEIETSGFVVDGELLAKAARLGLRHREVAVPHYARAWGTPSAGLHPRVVLRALREALAIKGMLRRMDHANRGGSSRRAAPVAAAGRDRQDS